MSIVEELEKYAKENKIPIMQKDGILYLCIKGFIIPIDSINKINKLIGNFIAKTTRTISNIFKSPSDLLLSNTL